MAISHAISSLRQERWSFWTWMSILSAVYLCIMPFISVLVLLMTGWVALIIIFSTALRTVKPTDIFILWILFFATVYISTIVFFIFDGVLFTRGNWWETDVISDSDVTNMFGKIVHWYVKTSTDIWAEFVIICSVLGAVILPQLCAFVLSGAFGSAYQPTWVGKAVSFAMINFIKALCVMAGLDIGAAIFRGVKDEVSILMIVEYAFAQGIPGWYGLAAAFFLMFIYRDFHILSSAFLRAKDIPGLRHILSYMTKFTAEHPPSEKPDAMPLGTYKISYQIDTQQLEILAIGTGGVRITPFGASGAQSAAPN